MTGKRQKLLREAGGYLLFLAPAVILFLALEIVPLFLNIGYSLTNWDGISSKFSFVGLSNYVKLFTDDPRFWTSMVFTIKNSLVVVVFTNLLGLAFALGLSHRIPLRNFCVLRSTSPRWWAVSFWALYGSSSSPTSFPAIVR